MINPFVIKRRKAIIPLLGGSEKVIQSCLECRYRCVVHGIYGEKNRNVCEKERNGETYKEIKDISIVPEDCLYVVKAG